MKSDCEYSSRGAIRYYQRMETRLLQKLSKRESQQLLADLKHVQIVLKALVGLPCQPAGGRQGKNESAGGVVDLTPAQRLRCAQLGKVLWPTEELSVAEISRRLLLEHLLWVESERNMVESVRG